MVSNRYEVSRQDNGQRLWYIWDTKTGQAICDVAGNTIYYDNYDDAEIECEDLNCQGE